MNFYEAEIKFNPLNIRKVNEYIHEAFLGMNTSLGSRCGTDNAFNIFFYRAENGRANLIFSVDTEIADKDMAINYIMSYLKDDCDTKIIKLDGVSIFDVKEITTERFHNLGNKGDNAGMIRGFYGEEIDMRLNYRDNNQYHIKEELIPDENLSLEEAIKESESFMADSTFREELLRIYSDENEKKFYGNPVHYKISVSNMDAAFEMANLLVKALKSNNRLCGRRINRISDIKDGCYDEEDFTNMFENARGNVVLLELTGCGESSGPFAGTYENVAEFFENVIIKNHVKTLCIFVENTNSPGFSEKLLPRLVEDIDIIELKEGKGSKEAAISYIKNLAKKNNYKLSKEEIEDMMPEKSIFTVGEVCDIYNKWFKNGLRNKIYKAYKYCNCMEMVKEKKSSEPYEELQKMIGLTEIKQVIDGVIDNARIQKLRTKMGMDSYKTSLHMIFTGNPGSAKTTVARLLAQILTKENILDTGRFVECGRADLVGKYVGWTAKAVRNKFREAKGGVLFIDEAYSLVDGSNSFGDEAINTIVQEMENRRNDVIVIFAGYPEKMKTFLDKNEGLRSRIAFHLNFPDYDEEEMLDILKLMAGEKGYSLDGEVEEKCREIFKNAVKKEEFGNGRFARNLLEQAMMAQSKRLIQEYKGKKITKKALRSFAPCDFDVNISKGMEKNSKQKLGFTA